MTKSKSSNDLLEDLGVLVQDKDNLRADILAHLSKVSGSSKTDPHTTLSDIPNLCHSFLNGDKGISWFNNTNGSIGWQNEIPKSRVITALSALMVRWLKTSKKSSKKKRTNTSRAEVEGPHYIECGTGSSISLAAQGRAPSFLRTTIPGASELEEPGLNFDSETIPHDPVDRSDDALLVPGANTESLPDHTEGFPQQQMTQVEQPQCSSPNVIRGIEDTVMTVMPQIQEPLPSSSMYVQSEASSSLYASPRITSKRRFEAIENDEDGELQPRQQDPPYRGNGNQRRVRQTASTVTAGPGRSVHADMTIEPESDSEYHDANQMDRNFSAPSIPSPMPDVKEPSRLVPLYLGENIGQHIYINHDDLANIPAVILDYIGQCSERSILKASDPGISSSEQQRYRQRSIIFYHILNDITSRIMSRVAGDDNGD